MPLKTFDKFREKVNLALYNHKANLLRTFKVLSVIVALISLGSIIFYYGFPYSYENLELVSTIIKFCFVFYILKYFINIFYDFHPLQFIKQNWLEGLIILFLLIQGVSTEFLGIDLHHLGFKLIGVENPDLYSVALLQFYMIVIIAIEVGKASVFLTRLNIGPAALMTFSFIFLIFSGAALLYLPEMTMNGIPFIDALFTSTSACCVTGLTSVDTATVFTLKGKFVIMMLIQFGGLNIVTFATFISTFYASRSSGLKYQNLLKDMFSADDISKSRSVIRSILIISLSIELIGAILIYFSWGDHYVFTDIKQKIFYSVFHSVSSFNNAGFALFTNNLYETGIKNAYMLHWVIGILIVFGGLGYFVFLDIFSLRKIRERIKYPWKKWEVNSKIVVYTTIILIFSGAILFYLLERNNSLKGMDFMGSITASFFQSISTRTCGFNTVDFATLGQPILLIIIFLMFIGASPNSTGGGVKTTTMAVIIKSAIATIKGKKNVELFKNTISFEHIDKANTIVLMSMFLICISTFLLTITEPDVSFLKLAFEEVSAFGTVGLSTGITANLSYAGKIIIILSMFIGRIGTLTLAIAISKQVKTNNYKYPNANISIG